MPALRLESLRKVFSDQTVAVHGLDLTIEDRAFVTLVGPSGCGKTTTLRMIAGLESPTSGTIQLGERILNDIAPAKRDIAMVFQSYALYPHMTVRGNLEYPLRKRGVAHSERGARIARTAEQLELTHLLYRKPRQLSGGQQQRVALGRAMIRDPALFLLDEPLSNLDAKLRTQMRAELIELHQRLGQTMIYVTHDQLEAMTMSDQIAVLHEGRLQQYASPGEVYHRPANLFVAGFIGTPAMNLLNGDLTETASGIAVQAGALPVPLPPNLSQMMRKNLARRVVLGVRPEDVVLGQGPWQGDVSIVEPIGHETLVFVDLAGHRLISRVTLDQQIRAPMRVPAEFRASRFHLFDGENGRRLN